MGNKKKTHTSTTTKLKTKVVKLTYLQTLAQANNLISVNSLGSKPKDSGEFKVSASSSNTNFGLTKKKKNVTAQIKTSGVKIKDTWLQPYFDKISYKIGIKELSVSSYTFAEVSEIVSVPFKSPKEIVKVSLVVDEYIPPVFSTSAAWIHYFVKVEGEEAWVRINPINKSTFFNKEGLIIPKIINFNLPKPGTAQLEDNYIFTENPVSVLRFKAVLRRPSTGKNKASMTPLLKSYRLVMVPRE